ncbi:MAG TPA: DEAD/DEAH box helicase [Phycisphaerae bacterium]|nr:DEAD/DEAH box helicase [Phycisphaerae bacterium]
MAPSPNLPADTSSTAISSAAAFELLSPGVKQQLWQMGWTELRSIQAQAIHHILESSGHCIIAAETAGGKTEAAFLPILSNIGDEPPGSVRAMYVGPLRALINDQFRRVEDLCNHLEMPVFRWHGDVEASSKKKLLRAPAGILLITPESLESLFVNRSGELGNLFAGLRFVVIDELHVFLGSERGLHLASLLARLRTSATAGRPDFRVVGLSATIGDMEVARRFIDPDAPERVAIIESDREEKEFRYRLHAYLSQAADDQETEKEADDDAFDHAEYETMRLVANDLVEHCRGSSNLVFTNAKGDLEIYADLCRSLSESQGSPTEFLVHHGSLSKEIREDTELEMKSGRPRTALCSSTMELGIDIGSVKMVGQIGPPWSVASFKQRIGRSGRKDNDARVARVYIVNRDLGANAELLDRLHLELVQAIAISELLFEGWIEPTVAPKLDFSTLTHQIISVIAETGGLAAAKVFDRLCKVGPFRAVEPAHFAQVLRCLGEKDIVEQTAEGDLILGLLGERLRAERDFYASFATPEEFSVLYGERPIGTLPLRIVPDVGEHIILAGRRWKIAHVDLEKGEIHVAPAKGRKRPLFLGGPGEIHDRVRQTMRTILADTKSYPYLNPTGTQFLTVARAAALSAGVLHTPLIAPSDHECLWFTWMGTRVQTTLTAMLRLQGLTCVERGVAIDIRHPRQDVVVAVESLIKSCPAPAAIAGQVQPKQRRKYDHWFDEGLLNSSLAQDVLDVSGALTVCENSK